MNSIQYVIYTMHIVSLFFLLTIISACGGGGTNSNNPIKNDVPPETLIEGSWSSYWSDLFHDGNSVSSANFIVYSEASSMASREEVLVLAEEAFTDIKQKIEVTHSDFDFLPNWGSEKIHILSDYNQRNQIGLAYRDGIIIRAKDSPRFNNDNTNWQRILHHELTHVVEFLIIGEFDYRQANAVWFREGFASYGARIHTIQTIDQLSQWKTDNLNVEGQGNPIKIIIWDDFPDEAVSNNTTINYYPYFELTVRYLTDAQNGHGTSISDVINFYNDLGMGMPLDIAFELHFSMSMINFEQNWWDLMEAYLTN